MTVGGRVSTKIFGRKRREPALTRRQLLAGSGALCLLGGSWSWAAGKPGGPHLGQPDLHTLAGAVNSLESAPAHASARRIASAALITDELLFELVDVGRLVSVSFVVDWASATPLAGRVPRAIPRNWGGAEELLAAKPDLVLLSAYNGANHRALLQAARARVVEVPPPRDFEQLFRTTQAVGRLVGELGRARRLVAAWRQRLAAIGVLPVRASARALVLNGWNGYAPGTLQHDGLSRAGLVNALAGAGLEGTPRLSVEHLLALAPEVLFVGIAEPSPRPLHTRDLPAGLPWQLVPAVQASRAFGVPSAWLGSLTQHAIRAAEAYAHCARSRQ